MKVLKFGGSSVATPEAVSRVVAIVGEAAKRGPVAVVVSALGGVTDTLLAAARRAADGDPGWTDFHAELGRRHLAAVDALLADDERGRVTARVEVLLGDLRDLLHGVSLVREASPRVSDRILSTGELLSSELVAGSLRAAGVDAEACDSRPLMVTDDRFGDARVDTEATFERLRRHFAERRAVQVVTGFIGSTEAGATTTLGRGGSDLTAALVGAALDAEEVQLWTDVSGVMSADPRVVPDAFPLPHLSYDELMELSHFGARVVYPPAVHPARAAGIPLAIRNTFEPAAPGTRVTAEPAANGSLVRGLASIRRVVLLRLEGDGMVGVPGIAMRLFGALAGAGISVILISQASSEHSICLAVVPEGAEAACRAVDDEFRLEHRAGLVEPLVFEDELSVIAVVGQAMCRAVGIAGRLFGVLGAAGVNVRAIAQGSSELNVSLVVAADDERRALGALHERFFRPRLQRVELLVIGKGTVGRTLLAQLAAGAGARDDVELRLLGVAGRERMVFAREGIDPERWQEALDAGEPVDLARLAALARERSTACRVVADCTASDTPAELFEELLAAGVSVVSANKRPFAGSLERWRRLQAAAAGSGAALLFEATVGAGLPVLNTLADLVRTGDRVHRIEGVLSGTLNFVLGRVMAGTALSEAVREAHAAGLTEPDPFEDLSGADVARKLLILARASGYPLEPDAVKVEPLLPGSGWQGLGLDALCARLADDVDAVFAERAAAARAVGRTLVMLGEVTPAGARVRLAEVELTHPAAGLPASDNLVAFTTDRYHVTPLVVRGPGAGPEVTAAGVLADVLRAAATARRREPGS